MTISSTLTDYIRAGTLASRPSSPPCGTQDAPFYYATDTAQLFVWNTSSWVQIATFAEILFPTLTSTTITGASGATITAADLVGGRITRSGPGGAVSDTFDTAANIIAAIPNAVVGSRFRCLYDQTTVYAITLLAGTGITIRGITSVTNAVVEIIGVVTNTGSPAVTLYVK